MRVLVVGQGGREHAIAWKLKQSPQVTEVYCAPGNGGTAIDATNVPIPETDASELSRFAKKNKVDLAVIGPEVPLCRGVSDAIRQAGIRVFGPSRDAAMLEGSKIFCKQLLVKAKVPTAAFRVFDDMEAVENYLRSNQGPCVVKADGLAAGKGAIVCDNAEEAHEAAKRILVEREFGEEGRQLIIEDRLVGLEASVLAITDGSTILTLPVCQDHKAVGDGDTGPNTGGMGAYSPAPVLTPEMIQEVEKDYLIPVLHQMRQAKRRFQGVLYCGLMISPTGMKVLEFNVRFGDPECQAILMRLKSDLAELLVATCEGRLSETIVEWDPRPAVCVVMASGGYPGAYQKGFPIHGIDAADALADVKVFHAGTRKEDGAIVTSGGRVLGVTALGNDLRAAQERAYEAVGRIQFSGAIYRRDIASKGLAPS